MYLHLYMYMHMHVHIIVYIYLGKTCINQYILTYQINVKDRKFPLRRDYFYFSALKIQSPPTYTPELHEFELCIYTFRSV